MNINYVKSDKMLQSCTNEKLNDIFALCKMTHRCEDCKIRAGEECCISSTHKSPKLFEYFDAWRDCIRTQIADLNPTNYVESKEVLKSLTRDKLQEVFDECCTHKQNCVECKNRPTKKHTCMFKMKGYKRPDEYDSTSEWLEDLCITGNSITEVLPSTKIFEDENSNNLVEGMIIKHSVNGKCYKVVKAQKEWQCDSCVFGILHENLKCVVDCGENFVFEAIKGKKEMNTKYTRLITDPISEGDVVNVNENCYLVRRDTSTEIELTIMSDDIRNLRESQALDHLNKRGFRLYRIPNENNLTNFPNAPVDEPETFGNGWGSDKSEYECKVDTDCKFGVDTGRVNTGDLCESSCFEITGSAQINGSDIITKEVLNAVLNAPALKPMDPFS